MAVRPLADLLGQSQAQRRFMSLLLASFGALALILAAVGIYGVVAYSAAQRTREFGVRLALGAQGGDILRLVLGKGVALALAGVALGVSGALGLTRFLGALLFGVKPTDAATFVGVALLLTGVAVVAACVPARRAARVDPAIALRAE